MQQAGSASDTANPRLEPASGALLAERGLGVASVARSLARAAAAAGLPPAPYCASVPHALIDCRSVPAPVAALIAADRGYDCRRALPCTP